MRGASARASGEDLSLRCDDLDQGIETHQIDGVTVRIYGVARTLVDCLKYRNKLGLDIAIEALRFARERKRTSNRDILHFARLLRQVRVIGPYLESPT
jgi:predicted transcriptional regulator of viral defense system